MYKRTDTPSTWPGLPRAVAVCLVLIGSVLIGSWTAPHAQEQGAPASAPATLSATWVNRTPAGAKTGVNQPAGSEDGSLIFDPVRGRVLLNGGKDDADLSTKETWAFDSSARTWEKIATPGKTPPASEDHTTIYDPNGHRMIVFGGENGPTTNKLWALDLKTNVWREMTNPQVPRRESHTAVYDSRGKRMVIFGGIDRLVPDLREIWAMDLDPASPTFEKWQNLTVAEGQPAGRIDHAAVYDPVKNRMVFYGGWTKVRQGLFGDTWAFYFADTPGGTGRWERIDVGTAGPPPRRHAVGVYDPDRNLFLLFGGLGSNKNVPLNDMWAFDLTKDVWMKVVTPGPAPAPRIDHQATYDAGLHGLLLYGGDAMLDMDNAPKLHDVWELVLPPVESHSSSRGVQ